MQDDHLTGLRDIVNPQHVRSSVKCPGVQRGGAVEAPSAVVANVL